MVDFIPKCCVCLNSSDKEPKTVTSLLPKLQYIVPEVDWCEDYSICETCTTQLEQAYEFRKKCIRLDSERKDVLTIKREEIFTCFDCGADFTDKNVLNTHLQTHQKPSKQKNYPCVTCDKTYSSEKVLKQHLKRCNTKTKRFSCEVCQIALSHAKLIIEHCVVEHSMDVKLVKPYTCDECPMRFTSSANLNQHKKYHDGNRSHICSFCGKSYITKSDLTVHEYTHFNRRNYKCEFCEKAFNTNKNLRSHLLVVHTDPNLWKYDCALCSRKFPLKSGYEQHMKRHIGDKKFVCNICTKSFVSRSELQKHMGYHSMVKPFKCDHCDKAYKEKRILCVHLTKSHGIGNAKIPEKVRKFACHVCPSTFFDKQKLERHLRTHSGDKPFGCLKCSKKFSDKYYMKQHMKNVHQLEMESGVLEQRVECVLEK